MDGFLTQTSISVDAACDAQLWRETGRRFARYIARRRAQQEAGPRRLLADFQIGSHALLRADRLMTLDESRYRLDFPELKLIPW